MGSDTGEADGGGVIHDEERVMARFFRIKEHIHQPLGWFQGAAGVVGIFEAQGASAVEAQQLVSRHRFDGFDATVLLHGHAREALDGVAGPGWQLVLGADGELAGIGEDFSERDAEHHEDDGEDGQQAFPVFHGGGRIGWLGGGGGAGAGGGGALS